MYMYMFLFHNIVVTSTCCDDMHGMSLYEVVLVYMHNVGLDDYMMKVLLGMNEVVYVALFMYEVHVKACSVFVGLISMCDVIGLHMYIAEVGLKRDYQ